MPSDEHWPSNEHWYVARTQAMAEFKAQHHLERQGFTVYLPRYRKMRRHARRTDWIHVPLFPRYLFVRMDVRRAPWLAIRSTIGISHLVCNGDLPAMVPDGVVDEIKGHESESGLVEIGRKIPFKNGEVVQITAGAMCDQVGLFDCETDDERVIVLLDMLGRKVKVRVPFEAVAAYL